MRSGHQIQCLNLIEATKFFHLKHENSAILFGTWYVPTACFFEEVCHIEIKGFRRLVLMRFSTFLKVVCSRGSVRQYRIMLTTINFKERGDYSAR